MNNAGEGSRSEEARRMSIAALGGKQAGISKE
jgi:hypothetical protein